MSNLFILTVQSTHIHKHWYVRQCFSNLQKKRSSKTVIENWNKIKSHHIHLDFSCHNRSLIWNLFIRKFFISFVPDSAFSSYGNYFQTRKALVAEFFLAKFGIRLFKASLSYIITNVQNITFYTLSPYGICSKHIREYEDRISV